MRGRRNYNPAFPTIGGCVFGIPFPSIFISSELIVLQGCKSCVVKQELEPSINYYCLLDNVWNNFQGYQDETRTWHAKTLQVQS